MAGKTAISSGSHQAANSPDRAIDGKFWTLFTSDAVVGDWIQVDLGQTARVRAATHTQLVTMQLYNNAGREITLGHILNFV